MLASDNTNCEPANPCKEPSPCDDTNGYCNLVNETESCSCKRGYTLNAQNSSVCDEIDECLLGIDACSQNCSNTVGGYECSCQAGFSLSNNGLDCTDQNECLLGTFECHSTQTCSNLPGSYECVCATGQTFKDGICQVIVLTNPVENVTETPSVEAQQNAVSFSFTGMTIEEYTGEKEITLFTTLAASLTTLCADGSCNYVATSARRRKRSTAVTFYKEDFSRLPGYPQIDSDGNLKLAIYSNVAGTGVLSSTQLLQAVQASQADIEASFGVTLVGAEAIYTTTPATTVGETDPTTTVGTTKGGLGTVYIIIIVLVILVVVGGAAGLIVFLKLRAKKNAKVASDPESSSARPQTARSVAVAPPAAQPERPVSAAQRPASSAPRSSTPVLTSHTPHVSNKVMLPPLTVPTSSADNPTEQIAMSQSIPPIEPTATKSGSRPVTPSSRPASGTAGGSRPASGSKQTQDHSRTATPVKNEGQTPLDG